MLKNPISTPEVDAKLRAMVRDLMLSTIREGSAKVISCEIRSDALQPSGYSFTIRIQGTVVPKNEIPAS